MPYKTLQEPRVLEIDPIKNSRFIAHAYPVPLPGELPTLIEELRQSAPDANHHCWAYRSRASRQVRAVDDGEPSCSAGKPILARIEGRDLEETLVVVVRYFGGTKLGFGGLVRAYGRAAAAVLDSATIVTKTPKEKLWIEFDYQDTALIEQALRSLDLESTEPEFGASARAALLVENPSQSKKDFFEATRGRVRFCEESKS